MSYSYVSVRQEPSLLLALGTLMNSTSRTPCGLQAYTEKYVIFRLCLHVFLNLILVPVDNCFYYTSDLLWKIKLVESIQSFYNSLWTWHDNFSSSVCLVTKPHEMFSSETEWLPLHLCFWGWGCKIKQLSNSVFAWYHELSKARVCIICLSLRLRQVTQISVLIIHDTMLNLIQ